MTMPKTIDLAAAAKLILTDTGLVLRICRNDVPPAAYTTEVMMMMMMMMMVMVMRMMMAAAVVVVMVVMVLMIAPEHSGVWMMILA